MSCLFFFYKQGLTGAQDSFQIIGSQDLQAGADTAPLFLFSWVLSVQHKLIAAAAYCGINLRAAGTVAPRPGFFKTACRIT